MSKKILIIILIGILAAGGFISFLVWKHYSKPNLPLKHYCQTDSDCILSGSDPEGFGICVNKEWYEEWKKSPESKKYKWDCEYTGKEKCGCINNRCQRIDSERECGVKETQVIITTNKTEYERGEEVKITLNTNGNTLYFEHYNNRVSYYRLVDGNWELIPAGDWAGCHKVSCRDGVIESICREVHSPYCKKVNNILEKSWDQKMKVKKRVRCGKDIVELHTYQNVPPGTYKVKIDYFKDSKCQGKVYSVYSNEFIIKEPTSKKCIPEGGTLFPNDGNKCCVGLSPRWNYEIQEDGSCKSISGSSGHQLICVKCGNGVCGEGENGCNCPKDCKDFKCKEHGEIPIFFPGDDMSIQCCKGLKHRLRKEYFDENCTNLFEKYGGGGYAGICLACGDGICDEKFESKCNCPEDCK